MIERRYLAPEFRVSQDANDAPVITGYAAVFNTQSADMGWIEEIDPHAFDSVLATNPDVRSLWNHNPDFPLGRTSAGTLSLNLDDKGLNYSVIAPDTSYARDLVVSMRRKDVTQSSFGFICKRDQWTDNADGSVTRRILVLSSDMVKKAPKRGRISFVRMHSAACNLSLPTPGAIEPDFSGAPGDRGNHQRSSANFSLLPGPRCREHPSAAD